MRCPPRSAEGSPTGCVRQCAGQDCVYPPARKSALDRDQEIATDRRQLLGGALGVSGLALVGTADGGVPLDHAEDEQLLMVLSATYRRLEHRLSSRLLIGPAVAHLSLIRQLRAKTSAGRGGRRLAIMT